MKGVVLESLTVVPGSSVVQAVDSPAQVVLSSVAVVVLDDFHQESALHQREVAKLSESWEITAVKMPSCGMCGSRAVHMLNRNLSATCDPIGSETRDSSEGESVLDN